MKNNFETTIHLFDGYDLRKKVSAIMDEFNYYDSDDDEKEMVYYDLESALSKFIIDSILLNPDEINHHSSLKSLKKQLVHKGYVDIDYFSTNEDYPLSDNIEGLIINTEYSDYYLIYRIVDYYYQGDVSIIKLNCDDSEFFSILRDMYVVIGDHVYDNCYDGYHYRKYDSETGDYVPEIEFDPSDISSLINAFITNNPDHAVKEYGDQYIVSIQAKNEV